MAQNEGETNLSLVYSLLHSDLALKYFSQKFTVVVRFRAIRKETLLGNYFSTVYTHENYSVQVQL